MTPLLPRHNRLLFFEFCPAIRSGFYFGSVTHLTLEYQRQIPWSLSSVIPSCGPLAPRKPPESVASKGKCLRDCWPDRNFNSKVFEPCIGLVFKLSALCRVSLLSRISCDSSFSWSYRQQRYSLCLISAFVSAPAIICHILSTSDSPCKRSKIANRSGLATPIVPLPILHPVCSNRIVLLHWSTK